MVGAWEMDVGWGRGWWRGVAWGVGGDGHELNLHVNRARRHMWQRCRRPCKKVDSIIRLILVKPCTCRELPRDQSVPDWIWAR